MVRFGYYISGHGYGHASRSMALSFHLLSSSSSNNSVQIISNAPEFTFNDLLTTSSRASYRFAEIEIGMVQPLAYEINSKATLNNLQQFINNRQTNLAREVEHLIKERIECVLSDTVFLGCAAAKLAGIPCILITNFTFDSCYSYLSLPPLPSSSSTSSSSDVAIDEAILLPLVTQAITDYSAASLLLRLKGAIPIPAFDTDLIMPASRWMNEERTGFTEEILAVLARDPEVDVKGKTFGQRRRRIVDVPLIARPLSKDVHSFDFRKRILARLGVPEEQYQNKILLVSFGGQTIPKPVTSSSLTNGHRSIGLLPEGWIAIVCGLGVSSNASLRNDLPANFYAANVNVLLQEGDEEVEIYVPDLTAMADVVLGKLGFGTCSETITASTPLVYVPRPLFVEEFGLKRWMESTAIPSLALDRTTFEAGQWEDHILVAYSRGKEIKDELRRQDELVVDESAGGIIVGEIMKFLDEWQGYED